MSDLRKAAEMALAKLDHLWEIAVDERMNTDVLPEIKALRQALAQPEQEPVAWRYRTVTFWNSRPQTRYLESLEGAEGLLGIEPLYTAPPKREWVGLTDDEIEQGLLRSDYALQTAHAWRSGVVFAMTKLKEKNNG